MTHPLDRPAWNALAGPHAALAEGNGLARRYRPDIIPFAAARDDSPESLAALAALPRSGEVMVLVETPAPVVPPGLAAVVTGQGDADGADPHAGPGRPTIASRR